MTASMAEPTNPDGFPAQPLHAVPDETPATAAQAEAQAEQSTAPEGAVRIRLGDDTDGIDVWVPDRRQWRNSSMTALHSGDYQRWADATLLPEDAEAWEQYDPTLDEIEEFFVRLRDVTGDEPGKRGRSRFGSRNTRRR